MSLDSGKMPDPQNDRLKDCGHRKNVFNLELTNRHGAIGGGIHVVRVRADRGVRDGDVPSPTSIPFAYLSSQKNVFVTLWQKKNLDKHLPNLF
jgi:hypothetical protein